MASHHILGPVYMIDSPYHGEQGVLSTYLIKSEESMIIDPGPSPAVPGVIAELKDLGIHELRYIALTHVHLDHSGGAWRMVDAFPESEVLVHPKGIEHIVDPGKLVEAAKLFFGDRFSLYGEIHGVNLMKISESKEGDIEVGGIALKVVYTPGHATHCQSFFEPENRILILGDVCGLYSKRSNLIFPASPPPFNPVKAVESLDKLILLRPEIVCFSHFGWSYDAVKKLTLYKEQLQLWNRVIAQAVKDRMDLNQTYDLLIESDPIFRLAQEGSGNRARAAFPNIVGFAEYSKWALKNEAKPS